MGEITLRAFCKVNLCLEITGRRDDGYHDLATVFQTISLADVLQLRTRREAGLKIRVPGGGAPEGTENLCWQAADRYLQEQGRPAGLSIELTKQVPTGAGLGGGSSDAAAVLSGLAALDEEPPSHAVLSEIAESLGADVPFFLTGGTALATGRGDDVSPLLDLPACRIVLVRPDLAISTVEAYGMLAQRDFSDGSRAADMAEAIEAAKPSEIPQSVFNGFSRALIERWPVLGELREALMAGGALAADITGSGSAVFGIFDDHATAESAGRSLADDGYWARLTEPVPCGAQILE